MKKGLISILICFVLLAVSSCRNANQAKQAAKIVKQLSGKLFKSTEKSKCLLRYGDDVVRYLDFEEVKCTNCDGDGEDQWGNMCESCDGDGYVYRVKSK